MEMLTCAFNKLIVCTMQKQHTEIGVTTMMFQFPVELISYNALVFQLIANIHIVLIVLVKQSSFSFLVVNWFYLT